MRKAAYVASAALVALVVTACVSTPTQPTSFFDLVKTGTPRQIQAAIAQSVDVNALNQYGLTPLMIAAAYNKNPTVVSMLLKAGADLEARDQYGNTALMGAATLQQNPQVIAALLDAGAHLEARDTLFGMTA